LPLLVEVVHKLLLLKKQILMVLGTLVQRWESHGEVLVLASPSVGVGATM
jgi:hypothetical protein